MQSNDNESVFDRICTALRKSYPDRQIHISIEAAHADQLGRPSDLVMRELLKERVHSVDKVTYHFIEDRVRIPDNLEGDVICLGGPRSNVLSRAALEYEIDFGEATRSYKRITSPSISHPLEYISRNEQAINTQPALNHPLFKEFLLQFPELRPCLRAIAGKADRLYSPSRLFRSPEIEEENLSAEAFRAISLRGIPNGDQVDEFMLADYTAMTIMPNVFSKNYSEDRLIIYHGLRSLGTLAALKLIRDKEHVHKLTKLVEKSRRPREKDGQTCYRLYQRLWAIARDIRHEECDPGASYDDLLWRTPVHILPEDERDDISEKTNGAKNKYLTSEASIRNLFNDLRSPSKHNRSFKKQLVKINQIDAEQILSAMALHRHEEMLRDGVYVLGCFEGTKTVYTQQARAYTLIHALHKAEKIKPGSKITIVGAGASGVAAAIAALRTGVRIRLVDRNRQPMSLQHNAIHRHLHPYFYDWPNLLQKTDTSDLPFLDWQASDAHAAKEQITELLNKTSEYMREHYRDQDMFSIEHDYKVQSYFYDIKNKKHLVSKWDCEELKELQNPDHPDHDPALLELNLDTSLWTKQLAQLFRAENECHRNDPDLLENGKTKGWTLRDPYVIDSDILIFATGFGEDTHDPKHEDDHAPDNKAYWENDREAFMRIRKKFTKANHRGKPLVIVSGSGDGAMIDILRLCIKGFNHKKIIDTMCSFVQEELEANEAYRPSDLNDQLTDEQTQFLDAGLAARIVTAGKNLNEVFNSDYFKFSKGENDRIQYILHAISGLQIENIFEDLGLQLNNCMVYNVDLRPQPFSADSATAHRLLVFALYLRGKVRFFQGTIERKSTENIILHRYLSGERRKLLNVAGFIQRHGVGPQPGKFLTEVDGLVRDNQHAEEVYRDGRRLTALLNLTNGLHPETHKFYRHTIRSLA